MNHETRYCDVSDDRTMSEEEKDRVHANNYASHTRFSNWTQEQRERAARNLGPNWASVLSGMGDQ